MPDSTHDFQQSMLALKPRIAVFDCDGTLWSNNAGEDFFYWTMGDNGGQRIVSDEVANWERARYDDYLGGKVEEDVMCGEMTSMYRGLSVAELESAANKFFAENVAQNIFTEMQELTRQLSAQGCALWAVSSTNEWVIRAGLREFPFPGPNILAAAVKTNDGIARGELIRVPTGLTKATAIRESVIIDVDVGKVDMVFGNSVHDAAMMELGRTAIAVNPNPDLEELARKRDWVVYWPEGTRAR